MGMRNRKTGGSRTVMLSEQVVGIKHDTFQKLKLEGRTHCATLPSSWMQGIFSFFSLLLNV